MARDDWSNKTIGELCNFSNGYGFRPPDWSKEGLPIIRIQNLNGSKEFNYFNGIPDQSWLVEPGTILFAWAGTRGVSFGPTIWSGPRGVLNQHIYRIHPYKDVNPLWLYSALEIVTKNIEQNAHGFKATLLHVKKEDITNQIISCPPLPEQQAIATALSDVDALITSLDHLIAKKCDIKQATMQQLLTGKRRLTGFSEKWEIKTIGEVFNVTAGGDFDPYRSSSIHDEVHSYPIYSNALSNNGLHGFCSYSDHQAGSITVTARGTLGFANFRNHNFTAIGRVLVLQPITTLDGRFFSEIINNQIDFVVESTGVPQLTAPQISKYELSVPPLPEQQAIASVLSDMDAEIAALKQKREKTHMLKQGMMQELLTGKTRLL